MIITSCITARGFVMIEELKVVLRQLMADPGLAAAARQKVGAE